MTMGGKLTGGRRVTWKEAGKIGAQVLASMMDADAVDVSHPFGFLICGSYRRMKPELGDLDLVVIQTAQTFAWMREHFGLAKTPALAKKGIPKKSGLWDGVQVDVLVTSPEAVGAAMMHMTGCAELNVSQRHHAKEQGLMLNEKGLWVPGAAAPLPCSVSEQQIYEYLKLKWLPPEARG